MIKFKCERCGGTIECADEQGGQRVTCPNCRHTPLAPRKKVKEPSKFGMILGIGVAVILVFGLLVYAVFIAGDSSSAEEKAKETREERNARIRKEREIKVRSEKPIEPFSPKTGEMAREAEEITRSENAKRLALEAREKRKAEKDEAEFERKQKYKNSREPKNIVID